MPKVTLLKPKYQDYMIIKGKVAIKFIGGETVTVSPAIALACQKKMEKGKPIFEVTDMPKLIGSEPRDAKKQNDTRREFRQPTIFGESLN